jgi:hypothetical protein
MLFTKRYTKKIIKILKNVLFKNSYSLFLKILIKNNIPIKTTDKSLKKGPEIKVIGKSAIKIDGKIIKIFSCI